VLHAAYEGGIVGFLAGFFERLFGRFGKWMPEQIHRLGDALDLGPERLSGDASHNGRGIVGEGDAGDRNDCDSKEQKALRHGMILPILESIALTVTRRSPRRLAIGLARKLCGYSQFSSFEQSSRPIVEFPSRHSTRL